MNNEIEQIFDTLDKNKEFLTPSDCSFIESLSEYYKVNKLLTASQLYHLTKLGKRYSDDQLAAAREWANAYTDKYRLTALRCARYYDSNFPRYYGILVDKVLNNPAGHKLTETEYKKMCENKYAKKVLACYDSTPKFKKGEFVQIRANNKILSINERDVVRKQFAPEKTFNLRTSMKDRACLVVGVDSKYITRAAKGSRIYSVLIIGGDSTLYAHESDLKRAKKSL